MAGGWSALQWTAALEHGTCQLEGTRSLPIVFVPCFSIPYHTHACSSSSPSPHTHPSFHSLSPPPRLIDCFLVEAPPTSLTFSPTGDFLASTHVDDLGIYLWTNKTLYSHISLSPLPPHFTPSTIELPTTKLVEEEGDRDEGREGKPRGENLLC